VTHDRPPPRLLETTRDEGLRRDLIAAVSLDAGYDVDAGAARFDAAIAELPPGTGPAPSDATASGASTAVATKVALALVGAGAIVAAVLVASSGDPGAAPREASDPSRAAPEEREPARVERPMAPALPATPATEPRPTEHHDDVTAEGDAEAAEAEDRPSGPRPRATSKPGAHREAPKVAPDDDALAREMAATHAAKRALASDPARALELAREADAEFPDGPFEEDRAGIEILALYALGDREAADARAKRFLAAHPHATYAARVRAARDAASEKP
jgi:hypothetical protein